MRPSDRTFTTALALFALAIGTAVLFCLLTPLRRLCEPIIKVAAMTDPPATPRQAAKATDQSPSRLPTLLWVEPKLEAAVLGHGRRSTACADEKPPGTWIR